MEEDRRARFREVLSAPEHARAARFVDPRHARRFVAARGTMRELLAAHLGVRPEAVDFSENAFGKPAIEGASPVTFNLSTSGDLAVLAISTDGVDLGIDIEWIRPLEHDDLARRYFSKSERAALADLQDEARPLAFFRCWTLKEAVVKATGEGLSRALDSFSVSVAKDRPVVEHMVGEEHARTQWRLAQFDAAEGCVGALAARTGGLPLTIIHRSLS